MNRLRIMVLATLVVAALVVLPTQAAADITGIVVSPDPPIAGTAVTITVLGAGICRLAWVNFGDGNIVPPSLMALPAQFQHVYKLPPEPRTITITATGILGLPGSVCVAKKDRNVTVQPGRVTGVSMFPSPANSGDKTTVTIFGTGECGRIRVTFGDGWADEVSSIKTWPQYVEHAYNLATVAEAPKEEHVNAEGIQDCSGMASTTLFVVIAAPGPRPINVIHDIRPIFPPGSSEIQLDQTAAVVVTGLGTCTKLRIDWGDGTTDDATNVNLYTNPRYGHTFTGWGGGKTVTAIGIDGCLGRVNTRFKVQPEVFTLAYAQPGPNTCDPVPGQPSLVVPAIVHITTTPVTFNLPDRGGRQHIVSGISFGCPYYGCVYGPDGKPGSVAASRFPFPGLREFSLVLRVGSAPPVQGGTNVQFTTTQAGPLLVCINDDYLPDNIGGLELHISVNQLGPPPPR